MDLFSDTSSILVASTTRNTARTLPQSSGYLLQRGSFCFIGQIDQHRDLLLVHDDLIHKQLQDLLRALCLYFQQTVCEVLEVFQFQLRRVGLQQSHFRFQSRFLLFQLLHGRLQGCRCDAVQHGVYGVLQFLFRFLQSPLCSRQIGVFVGALLV